MRWEPFEPNPTTSASYKITLGTEMGWDALPNGTMTTPKGKRGARRLERDLVVAHLDCRVLFLLGSP